MEVADLYRPRVEPVILPLNRLESLRKNKTFIQKIWGSGIPNADSSLTTTLLGLYKGSKKRIRKDIPLRTFLEELESEDSVILTVGENHEKTRFISLDCLYDSNSSDPRRSRDRVLRFSCPMSSNLLKVNRIFNSVYGQSLRDYSNDLYERTNVSSS